MFLNIVKSILIVSLLTACGGGGSSDSSDESPDDGRSSLTDEGNQPLVGNTDVDKTAPSITILGKNPISITQYSTYTDAGATAKDNVDGVVKVKSSGSVNTSVIKSYTITYTATDKAGNKATSKRTINVIKKVVIADITAPIITILGDNPASVVQNTTYTDAGATAKDTIDGTVSVKITGSVDTSTLGEYTITYTATDKAGNKATETRTVKVTLPPDTVAPIIKISGDNPLEISQGETFSDPGATATDDVDGVITVTPTGTVDMSTVGDYTITYTATDKAGNETNATRTVTVKPADVVWNVSTMAEFRQALEDAAANGENDRVILAKGIYNVDSDGLGTFKFNDNEAFDLTIEAEKGLSYRDVILDGNHTNQVFNFNNKESSTLILKNILIQDGNSTSHGGGVYSSQNIQVEKCKFLNNIVIARYGHGGGFYAHNMAIVKESIFSKNQSSPMYSFAGAGGGFYTSKAEVINSTISNNKSLYSSGGGFQSGESNITNTTISNNFAYDGGGFYSSIVTIDKSTIIDNNSSNYGGGFYSSVANINNSIISKNKSSSGGGGFFSLNVTLNNSTISHNKTSSYGGGFYSQFYTLVNNSIISNNSVQISFYGHRSFGGGFYVNPYNSHTTIVINSIFNENNSSSGAIFDSSQTYSYISNNIFIKNRGNMVAQGTFINNIFTQNEENINIKGDSKIYNNYIDYSKIEDNGHNVIKKKNLQPASVGEIYLTGKYALKSESPVIDKGLNPSSATYKKIIGNDSIYNQMVYLLKTDMLGNKRIHNSTIDMGAVEYGSSK